MKLTKWDRRYLRRARELSTWSKDPSTGVGAVLVDEFQQQISEGYNGFPTGVPDDPEVLADREKKLACTLHAEDNALLFAGGREKTRGATLYVYPFMPCGRCAAKIAQMKVSMVIAPRCEDEERQSRWATEFDMAEWVFANAKPRVGLLLIDEEEMDEE